MTLIDAWERFLKSLDSDGGRMLVLIVMIIFFLTVAAIYTWTGHTLQETSRTLLATGIGSLLGILYGYLGKRSA